MNNNYQKNTKEKTADRLAAEESRFDAQSLIEEIQPLLMEYFIGEFEIDGGGIILTFKNGQKFRLAAEEIK